MDKNIPKDMIDPETFEQILEMDDDNEREFSRAIVFEFFTQAETTFQQINENLKKKNLPELSSLGHYLKGSSATLGLIKIKDACEAIQNLGLGMDEAGKTHLNNDAKSLQRIEAELTQVRDEYEKVKKFFEEFYGEEA